MFEIEVGSRLWFLGASPPAFGGKVRHVAPYTLRFDVKKTHSADYALRLDNEVKARHCADYSLRLEATYRADYALFLGNEVKARHSADYSLRLEAVLRSDYGQAKQHTIQHATSFGATKEHALRHTAHWWLVKSFASTHGVRYDLATTNRHVRRNRAPWALLTGQSLISVANTPEVIHDGQIIRIESAELSCDEDSAVWLARIQLASEAGYVGIAIGDPITLILGVETFDLIVDGKIASRDAVGDLRTEITAVSPLAMKDAPWAQPISLTATGASQARALVESQVGPTEWALPDWIIPAGRAEFDGATPLAIARAVVESIGGLIESAPDGTPICRPRHPISVPDYASATPAHALEDRDVLGVSANIAPHDGFDRVTITNEDAAGGTTDRIEFMPDEADSYSGTVRAWPEPWRSVTLVHTGHPDTVTADNSEIVREVDDLVEFIDGQGYVSYPVTAIIETQWQHTDLGRVSASGRFLTASVPGYSLLAIRYTTTAHEWRVALDGIDEAVQFVLMDG